MRNKTCILVAFLFLLNRPLQAETFSIGSYIVNMGVTPQTVANGMKPYGMLYEFLKTYNIPVRWVIGAGKRKDSADFTYNSIQYKGGTFIIPKEYISSTLALRITYWKSQGVVMDSTTSTLTVTVTKILNSAPRWTLSTTNLAISSGMFTYAGIPSSSYNTKAASSLGACDDVFAMPHADPTWALHGNLYSWNRNNKGAIWSNCHAISVMESLVNPLNSSEQMNFLSTQGLIHYTIHNHASPAYQYFFNRSSYNGASISARADDIVFQMMGIEDAAHTNGSEQTYIPISGSGSGWRNTTKIGCYDSTQSNVSSFPNGPAAITLYGRGHGLSTSGYVMYQSGHNTSGTSAANVSAMRQFFNFSFMVVGDKVPDITASNITTTLNSQTTYSFSVSASSPVGATLNYQWLSTHNGTFSAPTAASTSFTTNQVYSDTNVTVSCLVTDACGRTTFISRAVQVLVALPVKLINFEGELVKNEVSLNWTAASEENLQKYEIERSYDAESFEMISMIDSKGYNNSLNEYSFVDNVIDQTKFSTIYYRLKALDFDGTYSYSQIIEIDLSKTGSGIVSIIPVPATDAINIVLQTPFSTYQSIEIIDSYGRKIESTPTMEKTSNNTLRLDISKYSNGIYFVNIRKKSGSYSTAKFIKN